MEWIEIKIQQPKIGLKVQVKTIYEFEDVGIWDGKNWINDKNNFLGTKDEAPQWKALANQSDSTEQLNKPAVSVAVFCPKCSEPMALVLATGKHNCIECRYIEKTER